MRQVLSPYTKLMRQAVSPYTKLMRQVVFFFKREEN